jgi:hypothetical protein
MPGESEEHDEDVGQLSDTIREGRINDVFSSIYNFIFFL